MLLPIRTDRPRLRPAYLTTALIVINIAVQMYGDLVTPDVQRQVTLPTGPITVPMDALIAELGFWGSRPSLFTLLSYQFIHGDWLHLISNMWFLWIFGSLIEDVIRPWGLALLYLGGGICAAVAHVAIAQGLGHELNVPMVGASGAVAAIMGLFMLRFYRTRVQLTWIVWVPSVWALAVWIALEVLQGLLSSAFGHGAGGVAHWAHVGGFAAGALAAPFLGSVAEAKREYFTDDPDLNVEYLRRYERAAAVEKALAADPGNAHIMRRLAKAYRYAGEYERATQMYQRAVLRLSGSPDLMELAAEVYLELVQHDETAVLPPDVLLKIAQQLETNRVPRAVQVYGQIVSQYVTRAESEYALLRLAAIFSQVYGQRNEALRYLEEFLLRYPNSEWINEARQAKEALT